MSSIKIPRVCEFCKDLFLHEKKRPRNGRGRFCSKDCHDGFRRDPERLAQRFWSSVAITDDSSCWLWKRSVDKDGYGQFYAHDRRYPAHRMAYWLATGTDPGARLVLHACDTPGCCNPKCLSLGSALDNARDRERRGRSNYAVGEARAISLLTTESVIAIRAARAAGARPELLAVQYGVSYGTITDVIHRRTWKHIA